MFSQDVVLIRNRKRIKIQDINSRVFDESNGLLRIEIIYKSKTLSITQTVDIIQKKIYNIVVSPYGEKGFQKFIVFLTGKFYIGGGESLLVFTGHKDNTCFPVF